MSSKKPIPIGAVPQLGPQQPQAAYMTHIEVAPQGVVIHRVLPGFTTSLPIDWANYDKMVEDVEAARKNLVTQIQQATPEQVAALRSNLKV